MWPVRVPTGFPPLPLGDRTVWVAAAVPAGATGTFESLGILVFRRDIEIGLVEDLFSGVLVLSRKKLQRYLDQVRLSSGRETYYEWYQWLSEQVERREGLVPPEPSFRQYSNWTPSVRLGGRSWVIEPVYRENDAAVD